MNKIDVPLEYKNFTDKERRLLKIKIKKISNKIIKPNCLKYLIKMRDLKIDQLNDSNKIQQIIKQSLHFHYGKSNSDIYSLNNANEINKTISDLNEFDSNCNKLNVTLRRELSSYELFAVKNDQLYFFPNDAIRNNITIFDKLTLFENRQVDNEKLIYSYQSNRKSETIENKKIVNNSNYNPYNNIIKKIKQINKKIKNGISKIKNEEIRQNLIKERRKNILDICTKQATKKVNSMYDKIFRSNRYIKFRDRIKKMKEKKYDNLNNNNNCIFNSRINLHKCHSQKLLSLNNKIKKIPKIKPNNSQRKLNVHKSLDEIKNIKKDVNKLKFTEKLENTSLYNNYRTNPEIDEKDKYDDKHEQQALLLLKNKIKEIYEKNEIKFCEYKTFNFRNLI